MTEQTPRVEDVVVPAVHLNGTSKDELLRQLADAIHAIEVAEDKLALATPHGRDYYVLPRRDAYEAARAAHERRQAKLRKVREELAEIAVALM
jgi:hypothetical protein